MTNLTPALLVGIGVAYTDLNEVISVFSISYLVLVTVTVLGGCYRLRLCRQIASFLSIGSIHNRWPMYG